jgi:hypothetical protein
MYTLVTEFKTPATRLPGDFDPIVAPSYPVDVSQSPVRSLVHVSGASSYSFHPKL